MYPPETLRMRTQPPIRWGDEAYLRDLFGEADMVALARRYDRNGGSGPIAIAADYHETVIVRA